MSLALPLLSFGIGLIAFGFFYRLVDWAMGRMSWMIIESDYFTLTDAFWDMLPWIAIIVGVFCLIMSGVLHRATKRVVYE